MITKSLKSGGFTSMPDRISVLYPKFPENLKLSWTGVNTIFDFLAIKEIKKQMKINAERF